MIEDKQRDSYSNWKNTNLHESKVETLSENGTEEDCWLEYCKRYNKLKNVLLRPSAFNRILGQCRDTMRCFLLDSKIITAAMARDTSLLSDIKARNLCKNVSDCQRSMRTLLEFRQVYQAIELRQLDQLNTKLTFKYDSNGSLEWYGIRVPELCRRKRQLFDFVIVQRADKTWIELLQTESLIDKHVVLPMDRSEFCAKNYKDELVNISFVSSGSYFADQHEAIDEFNKSWFMRKIAFGGGEHLAGSLGDKIKLSSISRSELDDRLDKVDQCQRQAVLGILRAKCWPQSYIVCGAPGTGKTHTIVEAIVQIFKRSDMSVLVCVESNNCADYLHAALKPLIPGPDMLRLRAGMKARDAYSDQHRILVTTNRKLASDVADLKTYFDYVFIDEADQTKISELLAPIQMLKQEGCLVLAGDCNSFKASTANCTTVPEMDIERSILQLVLDLEVYQRESANSKGDYITHLTECHQSDEPIVSALVKLFCDRLINLSGQCTPESAFNGKQLSGPIQFMPAFREKFKPGEAIPIVDDVVEIFALTLLAACTKEGLSPDLMQV